MGGDVPQKKQKPHKKTKGNYMYKLDWNYAWVGRATTVSSFGVSAEQVVSRLHEECAAKRLPALTMPYAEALKAQITALEPRLKKFKHMVVLGIGGSALGARALQKAFFPQQDRPGHTGPWLWIADNIDADTLEAWMNSLPAEETIIVPVSKSGGTIETLSQYFLLRQWLQKARGERWTEHMLFVTDEKEGYLRQEADANGIDTLPVPDHLGGRYSVLSAVGMVPAAFMGLPWQDLMDGSLSVTAQLATCSAKELAAHPAWKTAEWATTLWKQNYSQLIFFSYVPSWASLGAWFAQLWAESLGKDGKGTMPIPAVGVTDQHSLQQMFLAGPADKGCLLLTCPSLSKGTAAGPLFPDSIPDKWSFLRGKRFGELLDAECYGSSAAMAASTVPMVRLTAQDTSARAAGEVMGLCMAATLLTGWLMELDPLDQPAVELGKRLAYARLGSTSYPDEAAMLKTFMERADLA